MKEINRMGQSQMYKGSSLKASGEKKAEIGDSVDISGKGEPKEEKELKKMMDFLKSQGKSKSGCTSCTMGCT